MCDREMPRYCCHKEVWALKIAKIDYNRDAVIADDRESDGSAIIIPADDGYGPIRVDADYVQKHKPQVGGVLRGLQGWIQVVVAGRCIRGRIYAHRLTNLSSFALQKRQGARIPYPPSKEPVYLRNAVIHEGKLTVQLPNGKPATLAVIDHTGRIYEAGSNVCEAAWQVSIASFKALLLVKVICACTAQKRTSASAQIGSPTYRRRGETDLATKPILAGNMRFWPNTGG